MDPIPSTLQILDPLHVDYIRKILFDVFGLPAKKEIPLPFTLPVELNKKNANQLHHMEFVTAEKTDGIRHYLILGTWPERDKNQEFSLLVDRTGKMFEISVTAPKHLFKTSCFDGELVWEYNCGDTP